MNEILVGTDTGCRVLSPAGKLTLELSGRSVGPLAAGIAGSCVGIIDGQEIWRRSARRDWAKIASAGIPVQSILSCGDSVFLGGAEEAAVLRLSSPGAVERLRGFDDVPGRSEWFAGGPPLGTRSLASTCDGEALIAAVHVGGMPRSTDGGKAWEPTIPLLLDVHEVRAHPRLPHLVAAAAAVGLCVSFDGGRKWRVMEEGLEIKNSLAVAVLDTEVLFSIQEGPFAKRSQIWRWPIDGGVLERVGGGLPKWLEGKVDTGQIASGQGRAAVCDGGGNLWLSDAQSTGWHRIAEGLGYATGLLIL